ncbi:hypothetical protein RJ640_013113 [Escallonia rubra]|uniref:Uncharacterized protein n=1 Tax=Escallonia rubra TaxID=112253 RepID=A0AA88RLU5_9ASTE|nr:hypothetical protein RJ640_013113 [Escallonia rubra]
MPSSAASVPPSRRTEASPSRTCSGRAPFGFTSAKSTKKKRRTGGQLREEEAKAADSAAAVAITTTTTSSVAASELRILTFLRSGYSLANPSTQRGH